MWCELVLNGIGGRTIAEARERLSLREFRKWMKYREKHGGLNPITRTEWGAALISSVIANVNRGKNTPAFKVTDFAPHLIEAPISMDDAMQQWQ